MAKSYYCAPTVHLTTDQFTIYIVSMIHTYTFRIVHRHCILAVYCEDIDLRYVCHCTLSTIQICHHMSTPTSDLCRPKKHIIDVSHDTWYVECISSRISQDTVRLPHPIQLNMNTSCTFIFINVLLNISSAPHWLLLHSTDSAARSYCATYLKLYSTSSLRIFSSDSIFLTVQCSI